MTTYPEFLTLPQALELLAFAKIYNETKPKDYDFFINKVLPEFLYCINKKLHEGVKPRLPVWGKLRLRIQKYILGLPVEDSLKKIPADVFDNYFCYGYNNTDDYINLSDISINEDCDFTIQKEDISLNPVFIQAGNDGYVDLPENESIGYTDIRIYIKDFQSYFPKVPLEAYAFTNNVITEVEQPTDNPSDNQPTDTEALKSEIDRLRAELEQKEAEISALKKNAPAVAEIGYTLPNGYTTEFLDWIFDTLKVFDPTGRPKKQLEAKLEETRKNNASYSEKISTRIIPYAAQIARKAEARKGGAIKWK